MRSIHVDTNVFSLIWSLRKAPEKDENEILTRILTDVSLRRHSSEDHLVKERSDASNREEKFELSTSKSKTSTSVDTLHSRGKVRWVEDVVQALRQLGGRASLGEIYKSVREIREAEGRGITKQYEATIRRTIEDHSSDSDNFRSVDLFEKLGRGTWALRRSQ